MSWYELAKDVLSWMRNEQEASLVYYLLKHKGDECKVAEELGAPRTAIVRCRRRLENETYLKVVRPDGREVWLRTVLGNSLFEAMTADRESGGADPHSLAGN